MHYLAHSAVKACVRFTIVHLQLTVGSSKSIRAGAGEIALACVCARPTVLTRFIVCAVVEICKTAQYVTNILKLAAHVTVCAACAEVGPCLTPGDHSFTSLIGQISFGPLH